MPQSFIVPTDYHKFVKWHADEEDYNPEPEAPTTWIYKVCWTLAGAFSAVRFVGVRLRFDELSLDTVPEMLSALLILLELPIRLPLIASGCL